MIYELVIFSGGIAAGYIMTKNGYIDKFLETIKQKEEPKKQHWVSFFNPY